MPISGRLRKSQVPFSPPAGKPPAVFSGFPSLRFSAVPIGGNFISLLQSAKTGTVGGSSIAAATTSSLGNVVTFPAVGTSSTARLTYSGNVSAGLDSWTCAAMVKFTTTATTQWVFCDASNSAGAGINIAAGGGLQATLFTVVARSSGITLSAGVPYFIVVSQNGTTAIDYLVLRLDTGVVRTASSLAGTPAASNGTYTIGNSSAAANPLDGSIAAIAFGNEYISPLTARLWAADPWRLWY